MAQLRHDYPQFAARDIEVVLVGPEEPETLAEYWHENDVPFVGLSDVANEVLKLYLAEFEISGRRPINLLVDKAGNARFVYIGDTVADYVSSAEVFAAHAEFAE